jgi:putative nucleotidyltransferase with HDIG domain
LKLPIRDNEKQILDLVAAAADHLGQDVFVIGGFVRDRLLGKSCKDLDFVTSGDGPRLAEAVNARLGGHNAQLSIFRTFGTAMVKFDNWELEFVGARKESYSADSRKPSVTTGTLEDDQKRRDFTINAMAATLQGDDAYTIIDPFGGIDDLRNQRIVTPLDPETTFSDDPLRMMRAIRFATQLDFEIDPMTLGGITNMRERISIVSAERISYELNKIILADQPSRGFLLLDYTGLLKILFPELHAMKGVEQYEGYGHKDNFYHTLQVLDNVATVSNNLWLRWAAILHDIAKPATKRFEQGHGWTFHGHEIVGANMVPKIFKRMKLPLDDKMKYVQQLVRLHLRPIALVQEEITDAAIRRLLFDAGDQLDDLMMLCKADITSKNPDRVTRYLRNYEEVTRKLRDVEERDHLRNWQPPITGEMIMQTFGIKPGRIVGEIKTAIREAILDGQLPNTYEAAYSFMIELGSQHGLRVVG